MDQPLLTDAILIKNEFLNLKPKYSKENKEYRFIVKELVDMGFEIEIIDMCFCFFNIRSIEQAISYVTKEDGIWQHDYIESENKLCIICKENCDHLNYKISISRKQIERESLNKKFDRNSITSRSNSKSQNLSEENSEISINFKPSNDKDCIINLGLFKEEISTKKTDTNAAKEDVLCKVCEMESPLEDTYQLDCEHVFCMDCWYNYLEDKISDSDVKIFYNFCQR